MPTEKRLLKVFLCHSSQDKPIVRELYQRLGAEGWIDPWLDEEKLLPGQDWDMEIEKAVEAADVVIVCLSNRSVTKEGYVQRELRFALDIALEKPEGTIFIIPLKLEDCEPPRKLRTWQYVEYFPPDKRDNSFRLMKVSMQGRLESLSLSAAANDLEFSISLEPLSSKIISKKISDARQALQNDQLQIALDIYDVLVRQRLRLKEIINDLEDVSIVYSDSRKLWAILATAYRMNGDAGRAQEYEERTRDSHNYYGNIDKESEVKDYQKEESHNLDNNVEDQKQDESYKRTTAHTSEVDQQSASVSLFLPSTIRIETLGGISTPIFYKSDSLPSKISDTFSTATDNQSKVELHLVIGENKLASDNKSLGKFSLDGIPRGPKGTPQIDVQFEINQDLTLTVTATEKSTRKTKTIRNINLADIVPPPIIDPLPPKTASNPFDWDNGFSEFFTSLFGKQPTIPVHEQSKRTANDYDLDIPVNITFAEAASGVDKSIQYYRYEICPDCHGSGVVRVLPCSKCDSKGSILVMSNFTLRIPLGVNTGTKIRMTGKGHFNPLNNSTGNAYTVVSVEKHPFFERQDSDIFMKCPIPNSLAFQGGILEVPLLEMGRSAKLKIPANTKDGQVFRIANHGFSKLKNPTQKGNLFVTVETYDPNNVPKRIQNVLIKINSYLKK